MKVTKAVIPCGGMGTRFLPITKSVAKEILPVIDKPVLAFIVDELIDGGITDIQIILGRGKEAIRDYFTPSPFLEDAVKDKPIAKVLKSIYSRANITFALQPEPKGSGDAIARAKAFTGDEPFVVANGDDLIVADVAAARQLIDAYDKTKLSIVGVQRVAKEETDKYGIIVPRSVDGRVIPCSDIVEKPKSNPPSEYAALGRYVFTGEIYEAIEHVKPDEKGEIQLTEAIRTLMRANKVAAYEFEGRRYDMGDKFGALTAAVDFALKNEEFGERFKQYIKSVSCND